MMRVIRYPISSDFFSIGDGRVVFKYIVFKMIVLDFCVWFFSTVGHTGIQTLAT